MFRLSLLSLFLVAANADLFGFQRQLQLPDVDDFQFNFAGININAEIAQAACPEPWGAVVQCVISDCPGFMDVCPELDVPVENQGTVAPMVTPTDAPMTDGMDGMDGMDGNMTHSPNATMNGDMDGEMEADMDMPAQLPEVPSCQEIEDEFCAAFGGEDLSDCCLLDCAEQLQSLVSCLVLDKTGEDISDCEIPECAYAPPPAPSGDATATDTTPAPAPSGASAIISRMALLAATAFAFAML